MRRLVVVCVLLFGLNSGCCVAERAVDVGFDVAGKVTSKAIDAVASSSDEADTLARNGR
jgi:hypothetical protein